jgi:hypothetical protein
MHQTTSFSSHLFHKDDFTDLSFKLQSQRLYVFIIIPIYSILGSSISDSIRIRIQEGDIAPKAEKMLSLEGWMNILELGSKKKINLTKSSGIWIREFGSAIQLLLM